MDQGTIIQDAILKYCTVVLAMWRRVKHRSVERQNGTLAKAKGKGTGQSFQHTVTEYKAFGLFQLDDSEFGLSER